MEGQAFTPDPNQVEEWKKKILPDVVRLVPVVIDEFKRSGNLYRYLATQIPVLVDGQIPPIVMVNLMQKGSPAVFTGDYVGISTELTAETIAEGVLYKAFREGKNPESYAVYADKEVRTILAHEFTHILCDHIGRQIAHGKRFKDIASFTMACEIQANRGYMVDSNSLVYGLGVTEDSFSSKIPDIRSARTLESIYQAIKNSLQDKVDEEANNSQKENNGGKPNENSQKDEGEGQPNQASANQKTNESKSSSNSSGQSNETNQGESQGSTSGQKSDGDSGELTARQKQLVQKMAKEMQHDKTPETSVREIMGLDPQEGKKSEGENVAIPEYDNSDGNAAPVSGKGSAYGMGGMGSSELGDTPEEMLANLNERMNRENIKKALARLRATIKGNVSKGKTKTYSRPPRRTIEGDLMKKGVKKDTRFNPSILVALDKSGSMDCTKVTQVATAVDNIVRQLGRDISNCYICLHDGQVKECQKLGNWKKVVTKYIASGGNQFSEVYRKAQSLGCDVVLNVGDGLDEITSNRDSHGKKQALGGKDIAWFDVIVSDLGSYSRHYWVARGIDEKHGVKRVPLDICGGLIPLEHCDQKNIEELVAKNDRW